MAKERMRNEDARGGDVLVNDSIASGKPDLPIDRDPGRETSIGIDADQLGDVKRDESLRKASQTTRSAERGTGGRERAAPRSGEETPERETPNRRRPDREAK